MKRGLLCLLIAAPVLVLVLRWRSEERALRAIVAEIPRLEAGAAAFRRAPRPRPPLPGSPVSGRAIDWYLRAGEAFLALESDPDDRLRLVNCAVRSDRSVSPEERARVGRLGEIADLLSTGARTEDGGGWGGAGQEPTACTSHDLYMAGQALRRRGELALHDGRVGAAVLDALTLLRLGGDTLRANNLQSGNSGSCLMVQATEDLGRILRRGGMDPASAELACTVIGQEFLREDPLLIVARGEVAYLLAYNLDTVVGAGARQDSRRGDFADQPGRILNSVLNDVSNAERLRRMRAMSDLQDALRELAESGDVTRAAVLARVDEFIEEAGSEFDHLRVLHQDFIDSHLSATSVLTTMVVALRAVAGRERGQGVPSDAVELLEGLPPLPASVGLRILPNSEDRGFSVVFTRKGREMYRIRVR